MSTICGHQKQRDFLKKSFKKNRLAHALLFAGSDSLGKRKVAMEFIKFILKEGKEKTQEDTQTENREEKLIKKGRHPDLFVVSGEKEKIKINKIRELQHFLSFKPSLGSQKAVIVDRAEKMNKEAQGSLLKTLEEPKGKTLLILISSHPEMLLPTIYSRCQVIKFFPVSFDRIKKYLGSNYEISGDKAEMLAGVSQGKPGRAIDFLSNPDKLKQEKNILNKILEISESNFDFRFKLAKKISQDNYFELNKFLEVSQRYFRCLLLKKIGRIKLPEFDYFPSPTKRIESFSVSKIKKIIKFINKLIFLTSYTNVKPKLGLEVFFAKL